MSDKRDGHRPHGRLQVTRSSADDVAHVRIDDKHELEIDEPEWIPIGNDEAPSPLEYLLVATAGCQVEVLAQCLEKARVTEYDIHLDATRTSDRSASGPEPYPDHMGNRVKSIEFELSVETTEEFEPRVRRCLELAEDACIISRSVEQGIDFEISKSLTVT